MANSLGFGFQQPFRTDARLSHMEHIRVSSRVSFVNWIIFECIPCGLLVGNFRNKAKLRVTPEGEMNTKQCSSTNILEQATVLSVNVRQSFFSRLLVNLNTGF